MLVGPVVSGEMGLMDAHNGVVRSWVESLRDAFIEVSFECVCLVEYMMPSMSKRESSRRKPLLLKSSLPSSQL